MSLDYAILGFLNYSPLSGYDLKKVFDDSIRHFWSADQSQIYRTLNRLLENGWVEQEVIEQDDRPDRKIHHITEKGKKALEDWLISHPKVDAPHSSPLIQVFFAGQFDNEVILKKFIFMDQFMNQLLGEYSKIPEKIENYRDLARSERELYFWRSTLDLGIRVARTQQEWAKDIIDDLQSGRVPNK